MQRQTSRSHVPLNGPESTQCWRWLTALLRPVFVDELGLSPTAYDDAWETAEVLREATHIAHRSNDTVLIAATRAAEGLSNFDDRLLMARQQDISDELLNTDRSEVEAEFGEAVRKLADSHWPRSHVRVHRDPNTFPYERHIGVVASALAERVERERNNHPLVLANVLTAEWHSSSPLLRAVAQSQGRIAHEIWRHNHVHAVVTRRPDRPLHFWLDTGELVEIRR
jgi:hypothetical protein